MTKYHKSEANVARMRRLFIITIFSLLGCTRAPELKVPKTLLFSPIPLDYLADSAREWKQTGFDGFLLSGIMSNWADDIWAVDGDSTSRGNSDETLRRLKSANSACEKVGIKDNFIKVAFYSHLPLWRDTKAWNGLINNFAEAARFAKMGGCRGLALDIEYVSEQYQLDWPGYDFDGYTANDLRQAALLRGEQLVKAMLAQFPQMVFLTLPEGITFYGPLAGDFFAGMIKGLAEEKAPGGLHLLTERSYSITSTLGMIHYALALESTIFDVLPESQVLENSFAFEGRVVQVDMLSGYLDFTKYYRPKDWVCAYAYFIVESPADQPAQIRLGSNDSAILWVNGVKMLSKNVERSAALDADIVPVRLRSGRNSILVKVCNTEGQWGLYVRLTNGRGKPLKNISYSL